MNTDEKIETKRLLLLPGVTDRDAAPFLRMLREDGDFKIFCGIDPTEERIQRFATYFENKGSCIFSIFTKDEPDIFIGYVGISNQNERYEAEFYIEKKYRRNGFCLEALSAVCKKVMNDGLSIDGEKIVLDEIYATTMAENTATRKVLEKCGYKDNAMFLDIPFADFSDRTILINTISEYVYNLK